MQQKYESQGFVLIAQHRQGADLKSKVEELARSSKVNYTITQGGNVPGDTSSGIPHAFLFDWKGECVAEGHPSELYAKIDQLMAKAPPWIGGGKEYKSEAVGKIVQGLRVPKYAKAIEDLNKLIEKGSDVDKEEATFLRDRIVRMGEAMLEDAKASESEDPLGALNTLNEIQVKFKGHELGEKAKTRLAELKKDKAFQEEIKAAKLLAQMQLFAGQLKSVNGKIDPNHPANRKPVQGMVAIYRKLQKSHPETRAAAKAKELVAPFGL
ncbi:MAG: hypothetical protein AB7N76_17020 [Planctomycetota bacterium]